MKLQIQTAVKIEPQYLANRSTAEKMSKRSSQEEPKPRAPAEMLTWLVGTRGKEHTHYLMTNIIVNGSQ